MAGVILAMHGVILVIGVAATTAEVIGVATTGVVVITMEIMPIINMVSGGLREQMLTETTEVQIQIIHLLHRAETKVL